MAAAAGTASDRAAAGGTGLQEEGNLSVSMRRFDSIEINGNSLSLRGLLVRHGGWYDLGQVGIDGITKEDRVFQELYREPAVQPGRRNTGPSALSVGATLALAALGPATRWKTDPTSTRTIGSGAGYRYTWSRGLAITPHYDRVGLPPCLMVVQREMLRPYGVWRGGREAVPWRLVWDTERQEGSELARQLISAVRRCG